MKENRWMLLAGFTTLCGNQSSKINLLVNWAQTKMSHQSSVFFFSLGHCTHLFFKLIFNFNFNCCRIIPAATTWWLFVWCGFVWLAPNHLSFFYRLDFFRFLYEINDGCFATFCICIHSKLMACQRKFALLHLLWTEE